MPLPFDFQGHVALVTGANHGIGAATALTLASCGAAVVVSYLRIPDPGDAAVPDVYRRNRAMTADHVVAAIARQGGRAIALEADLSDVGAPARLFDGAEAAFGAVDIWINNATGWRADTFSPTPRGRFGHAQVRVSADTIDQQFAVDAWGAAHCGVGATTRAAWRSLGPHRRPDLRRADGFPERRGPGHPRSLRSSRPSRLLVQLAHKRLPGNVGLGLLIPEVT